MEAPLSQARPLRILFTSTSAVGHIHPMIPLARALAARGHQVRVATGPDHLAGIEKAGLEAVRCGLADGEMRRRTAEHYPAPTGVPPQEMRAHALTDMFGSVATEPMLHDLVAIASDWHPDLIIREPCEFAGPIAGAKLGIPHLTHAFGAIIPTRFLARAGERLAPLRARHGVTPDPLCGAYTHLYIDICPPSLQLPDIEVATQRQPLRPEAADVVAPAQEVDVRSHTRPLVYLTFGTVSNRAEYLGRTIAALAGLEIDLLVTLGRTGDAAAFGPQPDNVRIERYVPQAQILKHCSLVVSHAGSGTVLASLAAGIPQLCLPQMADQFVNAAAVTAAGAGLQLLPDEAPAEAITAAAGRLLSEPGFTRGASLIAAEIAAMPAPDQVAAELERRYGG